MQTGEIIMLLALVLLVALSAFFSSTETAFSSLNRARLKNMAASGNRRAALALRLADDYDKLLSTILIGNNIVNIASASLATVVFVAWLGNAGVTVSTVVMTVVVLIFGEISPKSLAKEAPEHVATLVAPVIRGFIVLFTPLNFLFSQWKKLLSKIFRIGKGMGITEEELLTIVEEAEQEGGIGENESELIRSAIAFNELTAEDILTPRVDVEAVAVEEPVAEIAALYRESGHSRLPVYRESVDHILGALHEKDFHNFVVTGQKTVEEVLRPLLYIPENMKISALLRDLQQSQHHMAVVVDEYGGTVGIVTMEDILEELVGEIWDEHDQVVRAFEPAIEGGYRVSGSADLEEVFSLFGLGVGKEPEASTVGGWLVAKLGRIPREGETFRVGTLTVTVEKMEGQRVGRVLLRQAD